MPAFVTPVACLVLGVVRHHVGELLLVIDLLTFIINVLWRCSLIINIVFSVRASEHLFQQN